MPVRKILAAVAASFLVFLAGLRSDGAIITYIGEAAGAGAAATTTYDANGYDLYATSPTGTNDPSYNAGGAPFGTGTRLTQLPSFVASITAPQANASAAGFSFYSTINNPAGGQVEGGYTFAIAPNPGVEQDLVSINIGQNAPAVFDIGILTNLSPTEPNNGPADGDYPDEIRLRQANGSGDTGLIATNKATAEFGAVDVYFFQVSGVAAGDTLTLSEVEDTQNTGDGNYHATLAGVLFPSTASVPEPVSLGVFCLAAVAIRSPRRRRGC